MVSSSTFIVENILFLIYNTDLLIICAFYEKIIPNPDIFNDELYLHVINFLFIQQVIMNKLIFVYFMICLINYMVFLTLKKMFLMMKFYMFSRIC